jgi:hypothetical protein
VRHAANKVQHLKLQCTQLKAELLDARRQCATQQAEVLRLQVLSRELGADAQAMVKMIDNSSWPSSAGGSGVQCVENQHNSTTLQTSIDVAAAHGNACTGAAAQLEADACAKPKAALQTCILGDRITEGNGGAVSGTGTICEKRDERRDLSNDSKPYCSHSRCRAPRECSEHESRVSGHFMPDVSTPGLSANRLACQQRHSCCEATEHTVEQLETAASATAEPGPGVRAARAVALQKEVERLDIEIADLQSAFAAALPGA